MSHIYTWPTIIGLDGTETPVTPGNGKKFTLEELKKIVEGYIEIINFPGIFPGGKQAMVINEEGLYTCEENARASEIFRKHFPIEKYPINNEGIIRGQVLVCPAKYL